MQENKKFKLQRAWLDNLINDKELRKLQSDIDVRIELLKKEQQEQFNILENQRKEVKIKDLSLNFTKVFNKITTEEKVKLLNAFIEDISINVETIRISEKMNRYNVDIRDVRFK